MLLHPDQDNGLILAELAEAHLSAVQTWFERFGQQLNENLAAIGYRLCPGDIMVRNPRYRQTLGQWQAQIDVMADRPTAKAARWSNIVFDFATLYGDDTLTVALRRHLLDAVQTHHRLLRRMVEDDARGRPALGFFNQLIATTRDATGAHIDLKRHGLRLIADAVRIFALHAGVAAPNTTDRLAALIRVGTLSEAFSTSVGNAYNTFLDLLLAHQIEQARAGIPPDTLLNLKALAEQERTPLRLAMRIVKRLQDRLQETFGVNVYY
jgi:CBS domain-containing protein